MKLLLLVVLALATQLTSLASLTVSKERRYWRFCNKCQVLFSTQYETNSCAAGDKHVAQGYEFFLPWDVPGTPTAQTNWRRCTFCQGMFYNGYPQKGRCPGGGAHKASSDAFHYVLPHDVPGTPTAQTDWRFCAKCSVMFYDGYPHKGRCPAGEGHAAAGYNFVLPHSH